MRYRFLLAILALAVVLGGCLRVYKLEIQQGNVITQEMIDKLKPGMSRSQVRFVMGSPLVTDLFHTDRWDYYYYLRHSHDAEGEAQHLTLFFKNDSLLKVQNDAPAKTGEPAVKPTSAPNTKTTS